MESKQRRDLILKEIQSSEKPLSASSLASIFHVSRQIIVGDIALLRACGNEIIATPRGYMLEVSRNEGIIRTIAVAHNEDELDEEIYLIIDQGGTMIDVIVEHPLYGQLSGNLHLSSRYDADQFLQNVKANKAKPLSYLTNGLHLHTIQCKDEESFERILAALSKKGFLYQR